MSERKGFWRWLWDGLTNDIMIRLYIMLGLLLVCIMSAVGIMFLAVIVFVLFPFPIDLMIGIMALVITIFIILYILYRINARLV